MISAPSLLDPAADELRLTDVVGRSAVDVARMARDLLGDRFSSASFLYVLMRAFEVDYHAATATATARWHECQQEPRALSDADLEVVLAPWFS